MSPVQPSRAARARSSEFPGEARPLLQVEYFTDPLCCWSWAQVKDIARLRDTYGDRLEWRNRMGGLIPSWTGYNDPLNDVSRPLQMAPYWIQVRHMANVPIDESLWFADPPESSFPACTAVKAAELQSCELGEAYLRRLREGVMLNRRNIARPSVLLEIAEETAQQFAAFDVDRFAVDRDSTQARAAFADDVRQARYLGINRFPALAVRREGRPGLIAIGYRPYEALERLVQDLVPEWTGPSPATP